MAIMEGDLQNSEDKSSGRRHSSSRKVLPTKPSTSVDSRLSMSGRMMERPHSETERSVKLYAPYILEYELMAEFRILQNNIISGMYIMPSDKDPRLWFGVLFIREGLYQNGVFRFEVRFSETLEGDIDCPRIIFSPSVFHPAISPETGDLNVAIVFNKWRKGSHHVWQVLQYVKDVFVCPEKYHVALNDEAAKMLKEPEEYKKKAQEVIAETRRALNETERERDDLNFIILDLHQSLEDSTIHNELERLLNLSQV